MKFARYLEETQVPEWKRAYIDYRGLKKRISAIKEHQQSVNGSGNAHIILDPVSLDQPYSISLLASTTVKPESLHSFQSYVSDPYDCGSKPLGQRDSVFRSHLNPRIVINRLSGFGHSSSKAPDAILADVLSTLNPLQHLFFEKLDRELEKVEAFYVSQENEARARFWALKQQFSELHGNKRLLQESFQQYKLPSRLSSWSVRSWFNRFHKQSDSGSNSPTVTISHISVCENGKTKVDPDRYQRAKRQIKAATIEFYRALEVLENYHTLNLIGFSKALKKFEKVTAMNIRSAYIKEKVETSAFASATKVSQMIKDTEDLFTTAFVRGDKKKAIADLRTGGTYNSYYFATFRTGLLLGGAASAFAAGLYFSFDQHARDATPASGHLLFVYSILFIPLLLSLLVGLNIIVWNRARINYAFIFGLDVKSRVDYRGYPEIPVILLSTLCCAFFLSFARIGIALVLPATWPLIWLAFCTCFLLNPFPIFNRPSRSWIFRTFGRLLIPGARRVKFAEFWMADQFCSLTFSLSNIYLFSCLYAFGWSAELSDGRSDTWQRCVAQPSYMAIPLILASSPSLVRLIQCIRCWFDSNSSVHLINAGKYATNIVVYGFYYSWVYNGRQREAILFFYCMFATISSIYGCAWDFLVDWSVLRRHCKHYLLREELLGVDYVPLYYLAMVMNVVFRFAWILGVPVQGPSYLIRTSIIGMLEVIRRWLWNFFRLENEHLGNVDQYRATREVPLPFFSNSGSHVANECDSDVSDLWRRFGSLDLKPVSSQSVQLPSDRGLLGSASHWAQTVERHLYLGPDSENGTITIHTLSNESERSCGKETGQYHAQSTRV